MQTITGYTDRQAKLRGIDFHWLEWGDPGAPTMVLLHGLTGHAHTWDHMAPALAGWYRLLAPDQRGHGDSGRADSYATAEFVDDLEAMARQWGLTSFVLMGLSMGGHNGMAYAAAHPERVSRLIVIDIPPRMDRQHTPNWDVISRLAETGHTPFATFEDAVAAARAGTPTAPQANLEYRTRWNLNTAPDGRLALKYDPKAPANWDPADLWDKLPSIETPVLLVRGGLTQVLPRDAAERMVAAIPDAELIEVSDSGHSVPTDRPEELQEVVLEWLGRRGG